MVVDIVVGFLVVVGLGGGRDVIGAKVVVAVLASLTDVAVEHLLSMIVKKYM